MRLVVSLVALATTCSVTFAGEDEFYRRFLSATNRVLYVTTSSNLASISNAVRIASGLRVGMAAADVQKYMREHGMAQTNVYSISLDRGRTLSSPYSLAGGATLFLDMHCTKAPATGLFGWSDPVLDAARVQSQGADIIQIRLTNGAEPTNATNALVRGAMVAQDPSPTTHLAAGKTNPELDRNITLDSLLKSVDELDLQKDDRGRVVSLTLEPRHANDHNLSLVSTISTLRELTIRGKGWPSNRWTVDGLSPLRRMTNLSTLRIACLAVEPEKNLQFLNEVSRLSQLRSLYLVCASQKKEQYCALTNLQNLATLLISYDTNFGNGELPLLTNLPNLKRVDLYWDGVTPEGTNVLSRIRGLTNATVRFRH